MERDADDPRDPDEMTFEEAARELEAIISRIEAGEIGLEQSLQERKRGEGLLRRCRAVLDVAEQEILEAGDEGSSGGDD